MCGCGKSKAGAPSKFYVINSSGKVVGTYSSETDARMASSQLSGSKVRPGN